MTLAGLPQGDLRKLQYALDMCAVPHPFDEAVPLEPVVVEVRQLSTLSAVCVVPCLLVLRPLSGKLQGHLRR